MKEKPTESSLSETEERNANEPASPEAPGSSPDVSSPDTRVLSRRIVVVFFKIIFLTPFYLVIALVAFGAGVGWHYYEASADLDLEAVERLEVGALVLDAEGREIGRAGAMSRLLVTREDIPSHFVDALIAAEDQRFFLHPGFDPVGSLRAAWVNYRAATIREGASTLTQQLARDVYPLVGKDADRKLSEIAAAVRIEDRYTKDEILVHYLNRIYFGSGFYGLGSAARGYFGKSPQQLTIDESALLCGLIPSPSRYSPLVSEAQALGKRNQTLRRMREIGKLSGEQVIDLLATETVVANSREHLINRGQVNYLLARVERELRASLATRPVPIPSFDGLVVRTAIRLDRQQEAAQAMDRHLAAVAEKAAEAGFSSDDLEAAFVMMENRSGRIVISVGSRDFHKSEYDRALAMTRPPGSAIFPFVYAAAFESGAFQPDTPVLDAPFDNREMGLGGIGGVLGEWSTENSENRWDGYIPAAEALSFSKNSPTARIGLQVGLGPVRKMVRASGIASALLEIPGSLLGQSEVNLTELTLAYTTFPNGGTPAFPPGLIREVRDASGKLISPPLGLKPERAMSAATAESVSENLTARGDGAGKHGKAGTTATFTDAWYFGYDDTHTWGVWVGRDSFTPIFPLAFGGTLAKPLADKILVSGVAEAVGEGPEINPSAAQVVPVATSDKP